MIVVLFHQLLHWLLLLLSLMFAAIITFPIAATAVISTRTTIATASASARSIAVSTPCITIAGPGTSSSTKSFFAETSLHYTVVANLHVIVTPLFSVIVHEVFVVLNATARVVPRIRSTTSSSPTIAHQTAVRT
uniref:Uncharacterized protein n=1 Tax=Anopheles darlingi TaxID=43151 RepID=A0A2M4DFG3_ANODA